jgi:pyruvate ferredoxin oxidoreductase beta subunit/2-oxoisovalerate ferredoxin oxidoreductase beta subunit
MAAHRIPYTASASIGYPEDFMAKVKKAKDIRGTRFIHLFSSCPTGWRHAPELTVDVARLAVESRVFPLLEVEAGQRWIINPMPPKTSVDDYLDVQGRFRALGPDGRKAFQDQVDRSWTRLLEKTKDQEDRYSP